jgi:glycosyltransferase 2 family protein
MTGRLATPRLGWLVWLIAPAGLAVAAYANRGALATGFGLVGHAKLGWLVPAAGAIAAVYLCRAMVYSIPLTVLGYSFTRSFLWATALVATSIHQMIPGGGAAGYTFLTFALHRRGVDSGRASLVALVDTLSNAAAVATLVVSSLVYLAGTGALHPGRLALAVLPGAALAGVAAWLYVLQRQRQRLSAFVLGAVGWLARVLGRQWSMEPVRSFLNEYYAGKDIIRRRPGAFWRVIALQYLALGCDAAALYMAFLALGAAPRAWVVLMGFVVAMTTLAVTAIPGGGGTFELAISVFFTRHGIESPVAIAAAVLYRVVAFWIPAMVSLAAVAWLRHGPRAIGPPRRRRPAGAP